MSTPHISAKAGDIAATVLMPGDPLRAKFIAETFLENPVQFNNVRGMLGFTGNYKGKSVSVMGSGMGMPSIGIYSYELFKKYNVENIIRVGSAGAYDKGLNLFDVVLANAAYSESSFALVQNGYDKDTNYPSKELNGKIAKSAQTLGIKCTEGLIHSSDVFYRGIQEEHPYWKKLNADRGCLCVEMESFALFHNAAALGKNAACLLTISDSFHNSEITTPEQREKSFTNMVEIALGAI